MRVQARKGRQQRGVDVEQAPGVVLHEIRPQNAHKARQQHQRRAAVGIEAVDGLHQLGLESGPVGVGAVLDQRGGQPLRLRPSQPARLRLVAQHPGNARPKALLPVLLLRRPHQGLHV